MPSSWAAVCGLGRGNPGTDPAPGPTGVSERCSVLGREARPARRGHVSGAAPFPSRPRAQREGKARASVNLAQTEHPQPASSAEKETRVLLDSVLGSSLPRGLLLAPLGSGQVRFLRCVLQPRLFLNRRGVCAEPHPCSGLRLQPLASRPPARALPAASLDAF